MLTEDWVELIKNVLSPTAFRDVAMAALRVLYGSPVVLADGTGDGGVDAWIELPSGRVPVQFHAGRSEPWETKLARDLATHEVLRRHPRLFFVCAQTPTVEAQQQALGRLKETYAVEVLLLDARVIATTARETPVLSLLSRWAGIPLAERDVRSPSPSDVARLAFAFFHEKSGDFRAEVARSVISACLHQAPAPLSRDALLTKAADILPEAAWSLDRELQAMEAEGEVIAGEGGVTASEKLRTFTQAALALQAGAAARLREDCARALEGRVHDAGRRKLLVDDVFDDLGLLVRESLADMLPGGSSDAIMRRFGATERRVADHLKPTGGSATEALRALVEVIAASPYGRALGTAELFMAMAAREGGQLAVALTEREGLEIWLDTSVALPMLCGRLDRVIRRWPTSEIAVELHGALSARGIKVVVPSVYMEEMAAHLVDAARRYRPLIGVDMDLVRSENFYVAQFHASSEERGEPVTLDRFDRFLQGFGLPRKWEEQAQRDYQRLRRLIELEQESILRRFYGIGHRRIRSTDAVPLPEEPERSEIVLKHDRCVARELDELSRDANEGHVLCSEDRWLVRVLAERQVPAIHPAVLLDALQIVRPKEELRRLATVRDLAATFSDRAIAEGAAVWDMLAELRDPDLSSGELLERAREFKEAWLARANHEERPHARDWQRFKAGRAFGA
jgi:hypothetical protein